MKKFKQRLLSMILVVLMVVGILPVQQMSTVEAETPTTGTKRIYFDTTTYIGTSGWGNAYAYIWTDGVDGSGTTVTMKPVEGKAGFFYYDVLSSYTNIIFKPNEETWDGKTEDQTIPSDKNLFTCTSFEATTAGVWGTYTPTTDDYFYVNADFVDYYNDARVDMEDTSMLSENNQGHLLGDKKEPASKDGVAFSYLNGMISKDYSGSNSIPLYFGALLFVNNRIGRTVVRSSTYTPLNRWNSTANVALTVNGQTDGNTDAAVQGLVQNTLGINGELKGIDGKELPFFSKTKASSWNVNEKALMKYYEGYEFPFNVKEIAGTNIKKYSYDSATDYGVALSTSSKKLVTSTSTHTLNNDGTNGYYPFNTLGETERSAINYGFGTKFTIPFTINENGTLDGTETGEPITFEFTGDDDVWVFLDGKLILDMGGAHGKATGSINFKNLTATVVDAATATTGSDQMVSGSSNVLSSYQNQELLNYVWTGDYPQERSTVATASTSIPFSKYGADFVESFEDSSQTHELVMFYMERGMYDSNMKVEFTINPLPSGLSLSKTIDTSNVNDGLEEDVKKADDDNFEFEIKTKKLSEEGADYLLVENLGYTLNNYNNQDTPGYTSVKGVVTGVGLKNFAHTFINTSTKADAFVAGTGFQITEKQDVDTVFEYNYDATKWTVYNKKNNYSVVETDTGSTVATFNMGDRNSTEFDSYDYDVNFRNELKVGALTLTKKYAGTAPEGAVFNFQVAVDLDGAGTVCVEKNYKLDYTIDDDENMKYQTSDDGKLTLTAGQTVKFEGIPAGAKVKVTEIIGETDPWEAVDDEVQEAIIESDTTSAITVTNKTKEETLNKVIYVEATETTDDNSDAETVYEVEKNKEEKVTLTELVTENLPEGTTAEKNDDGSVTYTIVKTDSDGNSVTTEITASITDGKLVIKTENANGEYDIPYKGTVQNRLIISGTVKVYSYRATNKVYVFDYGLESDIAATNENNDGLFQAENANEGIFYNSAAEKTTDCKTNATLMSVEPDEQENTQTTITYDQPITIDKNGKASGSVMFIPNEFMDQVETYKYEVSVVKIGETLNTSDPETGTVVNGTIKVMPASSVYYEDNFNSDENGDSTVKIIYAGNTITDGQTDVELSQSNDQSEQYGHDDVYTDDKEYSSGSATKMGAGATASFTFKGTGFDILSRTNTTTASIMVDVYIGTDTTAEPYKSIPLITYYEDGDLYQVPVIHEEGYEYGEYTVVIKVMDFNGENVYFYLDGIRIYGPLDGGDDGYLPSEYLVTDQEIRPLILSTTASDSEDATDHAVICSYQSLSGGNVAVGNTYVEVLNMGTTISEDVSPSTSELEKYWKWGPNNELYLETGNAVAFLISCEEYDSYNFEEEGDYRTLQVAAKLENGSAVDLCAVAVNGERYPVTTVKEGEHVETPITSASTMYYHVPVNASMIVDVDGTEYYQIIIANTSESDDSRVSLTNIKCCVDPESFVVPNLTAKSRIANSVAYAFATEEGTVNSVKFTGSVLRGKKASIQVYTSVDDIEDINIVDSDGNLLDLEWNKSTKTMNDGSKRNLWTAKLTAPSVKGKYTYTVSGQVGNKETFDIGEAVLTVK